MSSALISPALLFSFAAPCRYADEKWTPQGIQLGEQYRLPCFAELSGTKSFADIRLGWNEAGLAVNVAVRGKEQPPWCRDSRIEDSDGVQLFIDTRNTQNIHRAGRFCHRFALMPIGAGQRLDEAVAVLLAINRAKESPREIDPRTLKVKSERLRDGYRLEAFLPAAALTGYSPAEQPAIGFSYAVIDRELGRQTFSVANDLPFVEDPSLWGTLELVR
ncbi:MAG TPA: sugar-binding protein [Pirellulaceae bacterium]|nr:sugar-binding protein [Pirellulaceae bacterium]